MSPTWLQALRQPSLVRRLVLAQMATIAVMWLGVLGILLWQSSADADLASEDQARKGAAVILPLVSALAEQPAQRDTLLQAVDAFQRSMQVPSPRQQGFSLPRLYVWLDAKLIYQSPDAPAGLQVQRLDSLQDLSLDSKQWRLYAQESPDKRARLAVLIPVSDDNSLPFWSRGLLLQPLVVSLPLLVFPAWLVIRGALRPWGRLSQEIAGRGPEDLEPLHFSAPHRELQPLTQAVNQLLQRLRLARQRQRDFVADAAHELRTPIAAIRIHAEALGGPQADRRNDELLDGLLRSNDRAARLVEQLLALTRSEAAQEQRAWVDVDLERLAQECLAQMAPLAAARDQELTLDADVNAQVQGDPESLRSLLDNLVGNAVKYTPMGGWVRVRLEGLGTGADKRVRLSVSDSGPGIAPELRQRALDRFYRVPGQSQNGSGLGLSIVKTVADMHGAVLSLEAGAKGQGLVVNLDFADVAASPKA